MLYTRVATADHIYWAVEKLEQLKVGRARVQSRRSTLDETADRVAIASTKARPDVAQIERPIEKCVGSQTNDGAIESIVGGFMVLHF